MTGFARSGSRGGPERIAVVVKGYPRLSETFIAQEILALEHAGFSIDIWSLRHPTDGAVHMMHREIRAKAGYLPEYLYQEPGRVAGGVAWCVARARFGRLLGVFLRDLRRDPTPNRLRRFGQACVLARELPHDIRHLHVHYLHTPASVVRYAALLTGRSFSISAHAKDIFTIPAWEKREKIAAASFLVTCTRAGLARLVDDARPEDHGRLGLVYHGLDLRRFPDPPARPRGGDGTDPAAPVVILSVGRAVAKKGYDDLVAALARLPRDLAWRFDHIGGGALAKEIKALAERAGVADRVRFLGAKPQDEVLAAMAAADIFALACKEGPDGDRDGLPNVILEAATQALPILSTAFAGVPEFVGDGTEGLLVPPGDVGALAVALERLVRSPALRRDLGVAAARKVRTAFSFDAGIEAIAAKLRDAMREPVAP